MFIGVTVHETHESFPVVVILNFKATNDAPELVSFFATKDNATTGGGNCDVSFFVDQSDNAIGASSKALETVKGIELGKGHRDGFDTCFGVALQANVAEFFADAVEKFDPWCWVFWWRRGGWFGLFIFEEVKHDFGGRSPVREGYKAIPLS